MSVGFDATHRGAPDDRDINEEEQRDVCCSDIPRCGWIPSSNGELIPKGIKGKKPLIKDKERMLTLSPYFNIS